MFAALVMIGVAVGPYLDAQVLPESDGKVRLADARRFGVPDFTTAAAMQLAAYDRQRAMSDRVIAWNRLDHWVEWGRDVEWRARCWGLLSRALNPEGGYTPYDEAYEPDPVARRLKALNQLRALIGDRAFFAGVMPSPVPDYRVRP